MARPLEASRWTVLGVRANFNQICQRAHGIITSAGATALMALFKLSLLHAVCPTCCQACRNAIFEAQDTLPVHAGSCLARRCLILLQLFLVTFPHAHGAPITFQRVPNVNDVPPQDLGRLQRCLTSCTVNTNNLVTAFDANLTGVRPLSFRSAQR